MRKEFRSINQANAVPVLDHLISIITDLYDAHTASLIMFACYDSQRAIHFQETSSMARRVHQRLSYGHTVYRRGWRRHSDRLFVYR